MGLIDRLDRLQPGQFSYEKRTGSTPLLRVQRLILDRYPDLAVEARKSPSKREQLKTVALQYVIMEGVTVPGLTKEELAESILQEMVGYGPIDPLLKDPTVTEIMVNGPSEVYVERQGRIEKTNLRFRDDAHVEEVMSKMVAAIGRRIDKASPLVDGRLPDGSRINAVIPPLAVNGPVLTVRKFSPSAMNVEQLVANGTCSREMAEFLSWCVKSKLNILISGGTGSGKTTTLNALSQYIDSAERVITLEDCAELKLSCAHVVALETRPANIEGKGEITLRHLLKNALRMRPDRIIIGECRGSEAFELLQALNTGHEGSLSTVHANSAADALSRLENMVLMAGEMLPDSAVRSQIAAAIHVIVQQARQQDGRRVMQQICLVTDYCHEAMRFNLQEVFWQDGQEFKRAARCDLPRRVYRKMAAVLNPMPEWLVEAP
ncbi:MAG TPA: CpaF family protein [Firmicutes bacterium]|nr:CpaF family protein [Bacillota bacterium]